MNWIRVRRTVYALLFPAVSLAQSPRDAAMLRYWPAPLYWQPARAEGSIKTEAVASAPAEAPVNSLVFVGMTPCRIADTRTGFGFTGPFGPPSLTGNTTRAFPIQASTTCSIPSNAQAYSFNITVVTNKLLNYLTVWPFGATQPNSSTLNDDLGTVVANAAIIAAGTDSSGSVNVYASDNTDLIIDINGYYAAQTGITLAQGSASAPSLSFSGDSGTGVYSSATGVVNIAAAGQPALSLGGSLANTAVGLGDLSSNTSGHHNTGAGYDALLSNTTGYYNTASGFNALEKNTSGFDNTATGVSALGFNTTGSNNTASGLDALALNTTGSNNTAGGALALLSNTTGAGNTADGFGALQSNTTGYSNTADGFAALQNSTTAANNAAVGYSAMTLNTTGAGNAAFGYQALYNNTTGGDNTAMGYQALAANTNANFNTAVGGLALASATTGDTNVAVGDFAAYFTTTGFSNVAIGDHALYNNTGGATNIAIGSFAGSDSPVNGAFDIYLGSLGSPSDANGTVRIGDSEEQKYFFAAGVRGTTTGLAGAVPVLIDANGQMGTASSSIRFKEDVHDMADASSGLLRLRPVTFRYKQPYADGSKPVDYGLIAEEVAQVYPDLVSKAADGQIETVQYQKLAPMLLNELQKQNQRLTEQEERNRQLEARLAAMEALFTSGKPAR